MSSRNVNKCNAPQLFLLGLTHSKILYCGLFSSLNLNLLVSEVLAEKSSHLQNLTALITHEKKATH